VESIEDCSQGYFGNTMGGREFNAWNAFMASLGLMDVWNINELRRIRHKIFTWCRRVPFPIWSCLDRFYVDANVQEIGGKVKIWSTMAHISNHSLIFLQLSSWTHKRSQMGFNLQLLHLKDTKHQLLKAWKQGMEEVANQRLGAQVVRTLFCTKKESDVITKKLIT